MRKLFTVLVLCLCCVVFTVNAQNPETDSVKQANASIPPRYQKLPRRNPLVAFALSTIPSGGQFYNRQYVKAAIILGVDAVGMAVLLSPTKNKTFLTEQEAIGFLAIMATTIFSLVDAPRSAVHLNKKYHLSNNPHKQSSFTAIQLSPAVISLGKDFSTTNPLFGLKLTIR